MRPIRVAYLPASLRPGGAERQMLALAERLPPDRFAVEFVVLSGPGEYDPRARAAGVPLHFIGDPPSPAASIPGRVVRRLGKLARYTVMARRRRYDVVDAWLYPADVTAALLRPLTGTPVVVGGKRNVDPQEQFGILERPVAMVTNRLLDVVVANSHAAARNAVRHDRVDPGKIRVIYNGVDPIPEPGAIERTKVRHSLGAGDDEFLIGCVANYLPVKRHSLLIDAFGEIAGVGGNVKLVMVGEGPLRPEMEHQIRELGLGGLVLLHGSVPDARPLYPGFDLVVQASSREGLPNALLEASAAGRAIVATAAGGSTEVVIDGDTGLLVPIDDRAALAGAIRRAVEDVSLRQRLGAAARERSTQVFGMDRFVNQFADLYEDLVVSKSRV